jgi:RES domain-containing protein
MFLEMGHGFSHRFDPMTVCTYEVDVEDIVDLRTEETRAEEGIALADMECAWANDLADGKTPSSWRVGKGLIARSASGILVPSFATGARPGLDNLVLWRWGAALPHKVVVYDPQSRLSRNQPS